MSSTTVHQLLLLVVAAAVVIGGGEPGALAAPTASQPPPPSSHPTPPAPFSDEEDQEMPQGDQPSSSSEALHEILKSDRERDKWRRISAIKSTLLKFLRKEDVEVKPHQGRIIPVIPDRIPLSPYTPDVYTEKFQSFYPTCGIPRNTDEEMWTQSKSMNLHFNLTIPQPSQGSLVTINYATLRLYKIYQPVSPDEEEDTDYRQYNRDSSDDDKKYRVSVYWYTRSLKKNKVKKKLLDSQMVMVKGEAWTEWNIRTAVQSWHETGRNFGLTVQVEDEDRNSIPPEKFFIPMNCSQEASTQRPMPSFILEAILKKSSNLKYDSYLLPMVDLRTVEVAAGPGARYSVAPRHRHHHGERGYHQESDESQSSQTENAALRTQSP